MLEENVEDIQGTEKEVEDQNTGRQRAAMWPVLCLTVAFIISVLLMVAPLFRIYRLTDFHSRLIAGMPLGMELVQVGSWLPSDLGFTTTPRSSQVSTSNIEFMVLVILAFAIYCICALLLGRAKDQGEDRQVWRLIWLGGIVAGIVFVLAPTMLSNDIFSYANYGRLMVTYHANPYFIPPNAYPHDPIYRYNNWPQTIAVYGPISLVFSALLELIAGIDPVGYVLTFRLFAFAAHLVNIFLVMAILRTMGRSPRIVKVGTLLYAWNPLVLLESCLSGHNDILMVTFLLLGVYLCVRAERRGLTQPRNYLPPLIACTLAALVRFTAVPFVVFFIVLLACRTLRSSRLADQSDRTTRLLTWRPALLNILVAGVVSVLVALVAYVPFWIGHSVGDILSSFSSQPSVHGSDFSIMRAIVEWDKRHLFPPFTGIAKVLYLLSLHSVWNVINTATLIGMLLLGSIWLWRNPTTRVLILAMLATLGALLVVTFWFYPWYIIWLIGLAGVSLFTLRDRLGRALLAFSLTFSFTALFVYFLDGVPPMPTWIGLACLTTVGPPVLAFIISFFVGWRTAGKRIDFTRGR